jgi:ankyrin repeat protein
MRRNIRWICAIGLIAIAGTTVALLGTTGDTRVVDAAMNGDRDAVRSMIRQAVDVNAAQGDGMTALHWAALKGDAEMAQMLIYAGANLKASTRLGGYTPLFMASKTGNAGVVEELLKAGADPKAPVALGLTPLMPAAAGGNADTVRLLLQYGADPNAADTERGQTPLMFAAANNQAEAVRILAEHGARPDIASTVIAPTTPQRGGGGNAGAAQGQGRGGRGAATALPAAGTAPAPAAAAPAGGRGGRGATGNFAAANGAGGAGNGADAVSRAGGNNKGGLTPLMYAARQGSIQAATALLDSGANINAVSADRSTALLLATINAHFNLAKLLVERGADVNMASIDGATPLYGVVNTQWARHSGYPQPTPKYESVSYLELMKLLLDRGADPNAPLVKELWYSEYNFALESASAAGTTAFWKCAEVGDVDGMKLLVSRGADPNVASKSGVTPLLMASGAGVHGNDDITAPQGRMAAMRYLVEDMHADVNAADSAGSGRGGALSPDQLQQYAAQAATEANNGKTPTEAQIAEQMKLIQQQLASSGYGSRTGGVTALHNAAARGDNEMIIYLVAHGAKVDAVANNGATVIDMANGPRERIQPYRETIVLLEMLGATNNHKCVSC